ncbi:MAG: ABC transporter substrate-binding protein [Chloroflexi bacterium]|nr:ABC transporter substrate-binding protein [Chloroflexota bacterium]
MSGTADWERLSRRPISRRRIVGRTAVLAAGAASAWAVACAGGGDKQPEQSGATGPSGATAGAGTAAAQPKRGGALSHRINAEPPSLNLWTEFTYIVSQAIAPVFNQLLQLDPLDESKVIPDLAKSYEFTSPDKTEVVFRLQDANVTFHDGKPFSAEDVSVTYEWLRSPPKGVQSQRTTAARNIDAIEVVDAKTLRFKLKQPQASFLSGITNHHFAMGAKHIVTQTNTLLDAQQNPVGTGPFVLKSYKRNNVLDLERNKSYWRPDRPYIDAISVFIIETDQTALTNFLAGQLQMLRPSIADVPKIERELGNRGTVPVTPGLSRVALIPNGTRPPFTDVRMREAVSAAIDRDEFNTIRQEGKAFRGSYNNPKGTWALAESEFTKFTGYNGKADLQKAKQLMTAAGFADGYKGRMPARQDFEENAVALQAMLKKAGFDFTLEVEKSAVLTQRATATDFDLLCHTWATPFDDPDDAFGEMLIHPDRAGRNWAKIVTPEVDRLFDLQRAEFDAAKRKQLVNDTDKAALGNYPNILVQYDPQIIAYYYALRDYKPHVSSYTNQRLESVWLAG